MKWNRLLVIPLLIVLIGVWLLWPTKKAEAGWYDETYSYREKVTIPNTGSAASNQKVKIEVDTATLITAGKMQTDCDDTRFTDINGNELQYYINVSGGAGVGCNDASTDYYVLLPTILGSSNTIVYMYYGNPSAISGSQLSQFSQSTFSPSSSIAFATEENGAAPVAYWKFDEGTGTSAKDSSSNGNNGTLNNGPLWKNSDECISGKCLYFDGTDDYISHGDPLALRLTTTGTVSTWVKPNAYPASGKWGQVLVKGNWGAGRNNYSIYFQQSTSSIKFEASGSVASQAVSIPNTNAPLNTWTYLTLTWDGSTIKAYVNGMLKGSTTQSNSPDTSTYNLTINSNNSNFALKGYIDEPKIYNYARTTSQIQTDYLQGASSRGSGASFGVNRNQSGLNLTNGLVGWWKMDETSGPSLDSSGNNHSGTWVGNATSGIGKFGNGIALDGSGDDITTSDSDDFTPNSVTLSSWIYLTSLPTSSNAGMIMRKSNTTSPFQTYQFYINNATGNKLRFEWYQSDGSSDSLNGNTAFTTNTWYHVAVTKTDTTAILYINGVQDGIKTNMNANVWNSDSIFYLGGNGNSAFLTGSMDDARVYNRALSSAEVQALYNFAPGPVGYWKLEENTGTTANDSSGNNNNGTLTNGPTWTQGKVGNAVNFDGTDDYISLPSSNSMGFNFTMSAWLYITATPGNKTGIIAAASTGNSYIIMEVDDTQKIKFEIRSANPGSTNASTGVSTLSLNTWYHEVLVVDRNSNQARLYLNGNLDKTTDISSTPDSIQSYPNLIGKAGFLSQYFPGKIDDVRIYNYARSQAQILEDMNAGAPAGANLNPVAYWKFDEGNGTSANDSSGNGNTGTLTNMSSPATSTSGWTTSGKVGKGLVFDGSNDYVTFGDPSNGSLDFGSNNFTVCYWTKLSSSPSGASQISKRPGSTGAGWQIGLYTGGYWVTLDDGTNRNATTVNSINYIDNTWRHVCTVFDRINSKVYGYINSNQVGIINESSVTGSVSNSNPLNINGFNNGTNTDSSGTIDEVKIYNYALTPMQVLLDYNQGQSSVMGAVSTESNGTSSSNSTNRSYCVPGDTATCNPPVGEWKFEEGNGTTANDTSGNNNNGTLTNNPTWGQGIYGNALSYNAGNYVNTGTASVLNVMSSDFSVSAWVKSSQVGTTRIILQKGSGPAISSDKGYSLYLGNAGTTWNFGVWDGGGNTTNVTPSSSRNVTANVWHYVTGVFNASTKTASIYVDGALGGTATNANFTTPDISANNFIIGSSGSGSTGWLGQVDNVRIYNYARTPAQVSWDYNHGGPVAWYQFDECQGTTIYDSSVNNNEYATSNNGTLTIGAGGTQASTGTCNSGSSVEAWNNGTNGKIKHAMSFDGTDDYVNVADPASGVLDFGLSDFSVSTWVKTTSTVTDTGIVGKGYWGANRPTSGYGFTLVSTGKVIFETTNASSVQSTKAINDGQWHHLSGIRQNGTLSIYIDGVFNTSANPTLKNVDNSSTLDIGARLGGNAGHFNGQIDDVRIYNYGLTPVQVLNVYNDGAAVKFAPITGSP